MSQAITDPVTEVSKEFKITAQKRFAGRVDVTLSGGYGWIENPGNTAGPTEKVYEIASEVRYWF